MHAKATYDPHKALEWLRYYCEPEMREQVDLVAAALEQAERDRDQWQRVAREYETALADRGLL